MLKDRQKDLVKGNQLNSFCESVIKMIIDKSKENVIDVLMQSIKTS